MRWDSEKLLRVRAHNSAKTLHEFNSFSVLGLVLANPAPKELPEFSETGLINTKATLGE